MSILFPFMEFFFTSLVGKKIYAANYHFQITKLQRRLKSWIVRRRMARTLELMRGSEEMKQTHHRFRVLSEIMETEASYMTSLEVCKKVRLVNHMSICIC